MLGFVIRQLLDRKLTTIKEIEAITGRGTSTIYRWLNDESQPQFTEVRQLVRGLENPEAQRFLIGQLTADLPLVVDWVEDEDMPLLDETGKRHDGSEVIGKALLALDCMSHILARGHEAIRERTLNESTYAELVDGMNNAIRYLTISRNLLDRYKPAPGANAPADGA